MADDERPLENGVEKLEQLKNIVTMERKSFKEQLAAKLNISNATIHNMLGSLGIRKLCSRFVPYFLSAEMCEKHLLCCRDNLRIYEELADQML